MFDIQTIAITTDLLIKIGVFVVVLMILWAILKALLKLAWRIFLFGLGAIVVLGLGLLFLQFISR